MEGNDVGVDMWPGVDIAADWLCDVGQKLGVSWSQWPHLTDEAKGIGWSQASF